MDARLELMDARLELLEARLELMDPEEEMICMAEVGKPWSEVKWRV